MESDIIEPYNGPVEVAAVAPSNPAPWNFWQTIGLSAAIGLVSFVVQVFFVVAWIAVQHVAHGSSATANLGKNGTFLLTCTLFSYPVVLGLMVLFIKLRHKSSVVDYLALGNVCFKSILPWLGWLLGWLVLGMCVTSFLDVPTPRFMMEIGQTSNRGLLFATLVIVAPVVEELFFRGFMFRGIAASKMGGAGAIIATTLAWVAIHGFQYGLFECAQLVLLGIILGAARLKTGTIAAPIILHGVNNLVSVVALVIMLETGA